MFGNPGKQQFWLRVNILRFAWGLIYIPNNDPRICLTINQCFVFLGESTGARTTGGIIYNWPKWIQVILGELDSLHVNLLYYPPSNFQANITTYRGLKARHSVEVIGRGILYYCFMDFDVIMKFTQNGYFYNSSTSGWLEGSTLSSWVSYFLAYWGKGGTGNPRGFGRKPPQGT